MQEELVYVSLFNILLCLTTCAFLEVKKAGRCYSVMASQVFYSTSMDFLGCASTLTIYMNIFYHQW